MQAALVVTGGGDFESGEGPLFHSTASSSGVMCPSEPQSQVDDDMEPAASSSAGGSASGIVAKTRNVVPPMLRTPMKQLSMATMMRLRRPHARLQHTSTTSSANAHSSTQETKFASSNSGVNAAAVNANGNFRGDASSVEAVAAVKQMVINQIDKKLKDLRNVSTGAE